MGNCLTYHYSPQRTGLFQSISVQNVATWQRSALVNLNAAVRAAPLFIEGMTFQSGPHAGETHDVTFVCASDNRIYAFDIEALRKGQTGALWTSGVRPALQRSGSNIPAPVGIAG